MYWLTCSPGSTVGACTKEESFASIAKAINQAHKEVPEVITVIENMVNNSNAFQWKELIVGKCRLQYRRNGIYRSQIND